MDNKTLYRSFAILSFVVSLIVYLLTVQPSVPFWDCGEFSAASIWQQVPHPPGAPLFLMIGKVFDLMIPFGDPGWRLNLAAVVSSALTVLLLYLITVKVIRNLTEGEPKDLGESLAVYGSGFVAAMALTFSDTFWFNAVESEVYATSSLFVALVIYLMMRWNEEADNPGHERYLLLIAYLMGLSTGVHLLALLTIFAIVFLVYFKKYEFTISSFVLTGIISMIIFFVIYPGIVKWIPSMLSGHLPFRNECREYLVQDSWFVSFMAVGSVILAAVGLVWGIRNKKEVLNLVCASFLLMIFGYSTYTQILLRSNANPPMNENEPKSLNSLTSYLGREQYGDRPNWPRRTESSDDYFIKRYEAKDKNGNYIYGKWNRPGRKEVECNDGRGIQVADFNDVNVAGELTYLWKYQIDQMYNRYFAWNFIGRSSDVQDAGFNFMDDKEPERLNYDSGFKDIFPIRFYALPFILGLIGLFFHFYKDSKMAFLYMMTFLMMGVFTAIAQNQQNPQPRERDYFYAGSFVIFCLWIGMSVYAIADMLRKKELKSPVVASILILVILAGPVNMAAGGWAMHSRAGNFLPFDYSYNILQSTEKNAIIFTNGDNDTFPLWFIQDVEGVRRDVRVVNLSLGNTLWYVDQLKNREPWGAAKIPLSFSDDSLRVSETSPEALSYDFGEAFNISIPISKEIMSKYTDDPNLINYGKWDFQFTGRPYVQQEGKQLYIYRVQDKLVLDILRQTKLERPVYYSVTVGPDAFCGLEDYFRYEGMAMRICPVKQKTSAIDAVDPEIMEKCLMKPDNSENFHTEQHYGFKFRNLNNSGVFYDHVHRRLMLTYRTLFLQYANWALEVKKDDKKVGEILDVMNENISPYQFPPSFEMTYQIARMYEQIGEISKAVKYADIGLSISEVLIKDPELRPELEYYESFGRYYGPYRISAFLYDMKGEYDKSRDIFRKYYINLEQKRMAIGNDPSAQRELQYLEMNMLEALSSIDETTIREVEKTKGREAAKQEISKMIQEYSATQDQMKLRLASILQRRIEEMNRADSGITGDSVQQ